MPEGTTNIPVEQVIALVARDGNELEIPTPPPFNILPSPPSQLHSPVHMANLTSPLLSPARRHLARNLNEGANICGLATRRARENGLTIVPPSPSIRSAIPTNSATISAKYAVSPKTSKLLDIRGTLTSSPIEKEHTVSRLSAPLSQGKIYLISLD
jgi:hypothetical protein